MTAYIVRRLAQALLVLFIVSLLVFLVMHLLPGDPILIYLSEQDVENLTPEQIAYYRHQFGLDKPLPVQYVNWIADLLHGDFGISVNYHEDVGKLLAERLPVTIHLGLLALLLASIFGILTGVLAALRRGKWLDTVMTLLANIGITIPVFWLGILMIYGIGLELRWLPICGYTSPFEDFWLSTKQVIMPVLCLAVFALASTARQTRSSMLEVIRQDYIRTAWAKGLREQTIVTRHALKNALIPVVTLIGMHVRRVFGGSVFIETVFNIPGVGRLMVSSVLGHDYAVVQSGVLVIAAIVVLTNLIVDISYGWLDPRIRYG